MAAVARLFGQVGPAWDDVQRIASELGVALEPAIYWPALTLEYLEALARIGVRLLPRNVVHLQMDSYQCWRPHMTGQLASRYINVMVMAVDAEGKSPHAMDEAPTAEFELLYTPDVRNIAITSLRPALPTDTIISAVASYESRRKVEAAAILRRAEPVPPTITHAGVLARYEFVLCPDRASVMLLKEVGINAEFYPPEQLAAEVTSLPMFLEPA